MSRIERYQESINKFIKSKDIFTDDIKNNFYFLLIFQFHDVKIQREDQHAQLILRLTELLNVRLHEKRDVVVQNSK